MTKAFVFPGQGSQSVGMLADLANDYNTVVQTFSEASETLGYDLWQLVQHGPAEDLNSTDKTQPAMLAAGVAVWRVWHEQGGTTPQMMAGHSLGEYSALVCADVIEFADALKLVEDRGRFMQAAVPAGVGAMAAVLGMEDDAVIKVCESVAQDQVVEAVNFNSPGQVVVAGHVDAVNRAVNAATEAGAKKAILLPVSVPSHCALMKPAAEQLQVRMADLEFKAPKIPVLHNVDASVAADPLKIKEALVRQLYQPVRWVDCVNSMLSNNVTGFVECGPGKVLAGLSKRIARRVPVFPVYDKGTLEKALAE